jgi:hypothetical protein
MSYPEQMTAQQRDELQAKARTLAWLEANASMVQLKRAAGALHSEGWSRQFNNLSLSEWVEREMKR